MNEAATEGIPNDSNNIDDDDDDSNNYNYNYNNNAVDAFPSLHLLRNASWSSILSLQTWSLYQIFLLIILHILLDIYLILYIFKMAGRMLTRLYIDCFYFQFQSQLL